MVKNIKTSSDQDLILSFQKTQSQAAIGELINRYKQNIYTTILIKVKNKQIAEDIFQETFIKVVQTLLKDKYKECGKFLPWAIRIANNLCIDYFRKNKNANKVKLKDNFDWLDGFCVNQDNGASQIEKLELSNQIVQLLDKLPEAQREVIMLRIYADLSFKEIANILNVGTNTAMGRMRYGLSHLKKIIEEYDLILR
ncbi:MAG TPA: sigma-70 family RNA polymerase sigma factor [Edaphocola sp.]|nr:sigma-70 family RNA polymerase sigma factor [Edaphocola sp.]